MKKILLGAAIGLISSSVAYAQDYQFEVGAGYVNGENNFGIDYDGFGLSAQAHLNKVDTSKGPLNEAAFLDKSSFMSLAWSTVEADISGAESVDTIALGGRFVTDSDVIIEAAYADLDGEEKIYNLGFGMYINDNLDAVVSYQTYDEADVSSLSVDLHGVNALNDDAALAFDFGLAYLDVSDESGYSISAGADYYFNNAISVGAGVGLSSVNDFDQSTMNLRADYFVTPFARLGVGFTSYGQDADEDVLALNASIRF